MQDQKTVILSELWSSKLSLLVIELMEEILHHLGCKKTL